MTNTVQRKIFSISELTRDIRLTLEMNFSGIWMEGEISNLVKHTSGHMYLSLKDESAQISAVIFRNVNQHIRFDIKDGLKVLVCGKITVYDKRGQYQIVVEKIEPKGVGALELALRQLMEKLRKEGLFDLSHKKNLPAFPKCVGVITSPTGAVIRDILNVSKRRFPNIPVLLYPVKVQGDGAAQEISKAIEDMNRFQLCDVLIVGRGGGSLEDLWAFNEEVTARAIYNSNIPIISAVGHEIDVTVSDLVADRRAATPSQAAEMAVPNKEEVLERMRESKERMSLAVRNFIADQKEQVLNLKDSYALTQPGRIIEQAKQRLDESVRHMGNYLKLLVTAKREALLNLTGSYALTQPGRILEEEKQKLDSTVRQMTNYLKNVLGSKSAAFSKIIAQMEALSPLAILSRGYSLSFNEKRKLLRSAKDIKKGEEMVTQLGKGLIRSKVLEVNADAKVV